MVTSRKVTRTETFSGNQESPRQELANQGSKKIATETLDRAELVEQYRYFVYSIVKKVRVTLHKYVEFDELVSYGMIGLMEAADRYDPDRGIAFTTFSYYRIRGAVFDGLRQMGVLMRSNKGKWVQRESNLNDLVQTAASDSSDGSVGDDIKEVGAIIERIIPAYLLSLSDENTPEIVDDKELPNETAEFNGLIGVISDELLKLEDSERILIENLYFKGKTTTALAKEMGVTKSWVSRLHAKAIKRIRRSMVRSGALLSSD